MNKLRADSVLHSLRGRKRAKGDRPFVDQREIK